MRGLVALTLLLASASAHAADVGWRNDVGLAFGLFSGSGFRFARRFPEGLRVSLAAGVLDLPASEAGGVGQHGASVGTEVAFDITRGRTVRLLGVGGLGWIAGYLDDDLDGIPDDFEQLALGAGPGMEVLYWRNLSMTAALLVGVNLLTGRPTGFPEISLSYGL